MYSWAVIKNPLYLETEILSLKMFIKICLTIYLLMFIIHHVWQQQKTNTLQQKHFTGRDSKILRH